jgi:glucoamylase
VGVELNSGTTCAPGRKQTKVEFFQFGRNEAAMHRTRHLTAAAAAGVLVTAGLTAVATPSTAATETGAAPGRPGQQVAYYGANKGGFGTAHDVRSNVWFTLEPGGGTGEIYYPDLSTPAARALGFVVVDGAGHATRASSVRHDTRLLDGDSLTYRQTDTDPNGRWRLTTTYVAAAQRPALRVGVRLTSLTGNAYRLYLLYEPTLSNTPANDSGRTRGSTLVASDGTSASALEGEPAFTATSNGYRGTSDGWTDLHEHGRMVWQYSSATAGNVVQTARTSLTGQPDHQNLTLTLGFGADPATARDVADSAAAESFASAAYAYRFGWSKYLHELSPAPPSLATSTQRQEYAVSEMVLAASEDKLHRGAYIASPTMPWEWATIDPSGPYHLVWSRDLYEIATALIADGDRAGANRALTFLFDQQQKPDGSFPQNSDVTGTPVWTGLQLDEVADPIILAYQLHRFAASDWAHVKKAADFLLNFSEDGHSAPWSPMERWENQDGYSPATMASEIAGLVCAASIARANGDAASAQRYLTTADRWRSHVKDWTVTSTGPYSSQPYFLRLTKDGHPNQGTTYAIGDSGPSNADQRSVVDPSFLELVRLGVFGADDPDIRNSLTVVDRQLSYDTERGRFWHRASFDGYGETGTGAPWTFGNPDDSFLTHGRGWPLLNGERGEYDLAAGIPSAARTQLVTMSHTDNSGYLLPEQVWDNQPPGGDQPGTTPGTPTLSATPLAWTHAQFIRLAQDVAAGAVLEQPAVVTARYGS